VVSSEVDISQLSSTLTFVNRWDYETDALPTALPRQLAGLLRHTFIVGSVAEFVKVCAYVGSFMFYCAFMGQAA